jgi:CubicO group peptidase (beta-lactamase class C family)
MISTDHSAPQHARLSRRRLLLLSAGAATAVGIAHLAQAPGVAAAQGSAPSTSSTPSTPSVPMVLASDASSRFKALADLVARTMATVGVPAAALGILANGREEHAVFGVANSDTNRPVTPDTRFQIGSVTKTYTATAVMRLVDQGQLELDAPSAPTCPPSRCRTRRRPNG